jgi:threonine/homoserine/homoserine lactone efflux protein
MIASLLAFTLAAALLTITPGADTLLVVRFAAGRGRAAGFAAAAGILSGVLVWGAIVAVGVAALILASPMLFRTLQWAGALYLIWLGLQLLLPSRTRDQSAPKGSSASPFLSGLLTNLLNPKVGVFYLAFLPPFIPPGVPHGPYIFLLAAIHAFLGLLWFLVLIGGIGHATTRLSGGRLAAWLAKITGLLFVGFGARLLLSSR